MRRTAVMVALICSGLVACGGGEDGGSGAGARPGGSDKGGPGGSAAEVAPAGVVDPGVCPPLDEVAQRAGEDLGLTYAVDVEGELDCTYMSEDGLRVMVHCEDYESVEAAVEDIDIRRTSVPGTEPYDGVAGEEGVIQNMEQSDPVLETIGYRTIVRQGTRICQSLWASEEAPASDQAAGLRGMLDYLMVTVVS